MALISGQKFLFNVFLLCGLFLPSWEKVALTLNDLRVLLLLMLAKGLSYLLALVSVSVKWRWEYSPCKVRARIK